jgi:hypothetical protein
MVSGLDHGARLEAGRGDHDLAVEAGGFFQPVHPAFEAQSVDEQELRGREVLGVGWRRLIDMRVAVGPDQRDDIDPVAADLFHHVAEDRERGDGLDLVRRVGAVGETKQDEQCEADLHHKTSLHDTTLLRLRGIRLPGACVARGDK